METPLAIVYSKEGGMEGGTGGRRGSTLGLGCTNGSTLELRASRLLLSMPRSMNGVPAPARGRNGGGDGGDCVKRV